MINEINKIEVIIIDQENKFILIKFILKFFRETIVKIKFLLNLKLMIFH